MFCGPLALRETQRLCFCLLSCCFCIVVVSFVNCKLGMLQIETSATITFFSWILQPVCYGELLAVFFLKCAMDFLDHPLLSKGALTSALVTVLTLNVRNCSDAGSAIFVSAVPRKYRRMHVDKTFFWMKLIQSFHKVSINCFKVLMRKADKENKKRERERKKEKCFSHFFFSLAVRKRTASTFQGDSRTMHLPLIKRKRKKKKKSSVRFGDI